jgi:signal transduction histidine kinase
MSIKTKLVVIFLAFTFVPMSILGTLVFYKADNALEAVRLSQLENIADLKKDKIETFFTERKGDMKSAQSFRIIRSNLPVLIKFSHEPKSGAYRKAEEELDSQIKSFQEGYEYLDVMLAGPDGSIVYVSNKAHRENQLGRILPVAEAFEEGRRDVYFSDVFENEADGNRFEMLAAAPARDLKGSFAGEVIFEIDMEPIYQFVKETTGLGNTGEALIVKQEGNAALFLTPLRRDPGAALKRRVSFNEKDAFPAQMSAQGKSGSGRTLDYTDIDILAAWRYIPSLRWGLVAKIDTSEAFEPIVHLRNLSVVLGIVVMALGVVAALSVAKSLSGPITALQRGAERIGGGDLSYRVATGARDEIGQLSRAFDRMTEALSRTNAELRQKAAELQASNEELESFSYSVSHDLRAPLRHISGFMELLQKHSLPALDETGRRYMRMIIESSRRMGLLIDDLLAFSRMGRSEMQMKTLNLEELVEEVIREMQRETEGRDIVWKIGSLPVVQGDSVMLRLVLVNLISNAVKFTRTRSRAEIEIGCNAGKEEHVCFVRDNGVGFDMKYAKKLFGVFQRLHRQEEFEGTGIGLANVRRIVARHGGRTWAEGSVDGGATVCFTLPIIEEREK